MNSTLEFAYHSNVELNDDIKIETNKGMTRLILKPDEDK